MPREQRTQQAESRKHDASEGAPDACRELLAIAAELEHFAQSARILAGARFAGVERRREELLQRLRRVRLAGAGLRGADQAPYPDARMLFVHHVKLCAAFLRQQRSEYPQSIDTEGERDLAVQTASVVAQSYPAIADKMREPDRVARIRELIVSAAASGSRTPWKLFVGAWKGIENGAADEEDWRSRWNKAKRT